MTYKFYLLPIGFGENSFKDLEAQIDGYALGVKLVKCITPEMPRDLSAAIIDFDKRHLDEKLNISSEILPDRPIIALCDTLVELDNIITLKKPLNCNSLRLVLDKIISKGMPLRQKQREIRAIYSNPESPLHYSINNCFQAYLVNAWKTHQTVNSPIELTFLNKQVLVLYEDKVSVWLSSERLQQLCTLTIHDHSMSATLLSSSPVALQNVDAIYFIAQVALWSSCGRLPFGINSTDIVRLTEPEKQYHLPEIEGSNFMRELWLNSSYSLYETEQLLQVDQTNLFSYFSVLYALDFVEVLSSKPSSNASLKDKKKLSKWEWLEKKLFINKRVPLSNSF